MVHSRNIVHTVLFTLTSISVLKLSSFLTASFIAGPYMAFFSGINVTGPLVGAFGGVLGTSTVFGILFLIRFLLQGIGSLHVLAYIVPGMCASLYWASESKIIRLVLPLVCMIAFWVHPVGAQAWPYACLWFIPLVLYKAPRTRLYTALASTFVAHAVGSVIWLYTVPMSPALWIGLIPLVILERCTFAAGMVVVHALIEKVAQIKIHGGAKALKAHL